MKKYFQIIIVLFLLVSVIKAQVLFVEDFNYTAGTGDSLKAHGWTLSGTNNLNPLMVTSPGLTFPNYPSNAGNSTTINNSGQDVYKNLTSSITSGSAYLSFLVNVQSASTIGDYFIALSPASSQTNYYARVHIKAQANNWQVGISKSNELAGGYVYGNTLLNYNTTYLIVVKHTLITGTNNDEERIFVFTGTIPSTEPTSSEVGPYVETTKGDPTDLMTVTLRQGGSFSSGVMTNPGPVLKLDGIRVMTSWASLVTEVKDNSSSLPNDFSLSQNYPNPFNPSTVISWQLAVSSFVTLNIYDMLGRKVASLVNEFQQAGIHNFKLNTQNYSLPSGIYFYQISAGEYIDTKKMILMK